MFLETSKKEKILVSKIDFEELQKIKWHISNSGYARATKAIRVYGSCFIHRAILGKPPKGLCIDHINGNKLDNRRKNLRFATYSVNGYNRKKLHGKNTSGFNGVYFHEQTKKWRVLVSVGLFKTKREAVKMRLKALEGLSKCFTV